MYVCTAPVKLSALEKLFYLSIQNMYVCMYVRIPSHSSYLCEKGIFAAVTCDVGTLTVESIDVLLKIHRIRDVKIDVEKQEKWLKKEIKVPNESCSLSKAHRATYADKILDTPNNYRVLDNNRCILACDFATIAWSGWLNFSILNGMAEVLHIENEDTAALLLNNIGRGVCQQARKSRMSLDITLC